jgi:hypothetical protein
MQQTKTVTDYVIAASKSACEILGVDFVSIPDHLILVRIYLVLNQLCHGNREHMKGWVNTYNFRLGYVPGTMFYNRIKMEEILTHIQGMLFV